MKASRAAEVTTLELQPSICKMTCQAKGGSLAPSLPTGMYSNQVIQSHESHCLFNYYATLPYLGNLPLRTTTPERGAAL